VNTQRNEVTAIREGFVTLVSISVARVTHHYRGRVRPADGPGAHHPDDARADRAAEGAVGIVLLGGFVFRMPWIVPVVGIVLGAAALGGARTDLLRGAFARLVAPRLGPPVGFLDPATLRAQDGVLAGLCGLASLAFMVLTSLGWLIAIAAAIVAIVAATAGIHLGAWAVARLQRG
jgi:hypothetical protein